MLISFRRASTVLAYLALTLLLCLFAWHSATRSAAGSLSMSLSSTLPAQLEAAFQYQLDHEADQLVMTTINEHLRSLRVQGMPGMLRQCSARLDTLDAGPDTPATGFIPGSWRVGEQRLLIPWRHAGAVSHARISMNCTPEPAVLLLSQGVLAALLLALLLWVPDQWRRRIPWLMRALRRQPGQPLSALRAALAKDHLLIDPGRFTITVHGIEIALPGTPFFYYLWYAQRRINDNPDGGWYLNPAVNRADLDAAAELQALMKVHGGHNKAINDLERQGLRARILDRNRNRIKDELVEALGERLAGDWLFESRRDPVSQRHAYRLATPPESIHMADGNGVPTTSRESDVPTPE